VTQPATTQQKEEFGECAAGGHLAGDRRKRQRASFDDTWGYAASASQAFRTVLYTGESIKSGLGIRVP
jgi:hypothetical protein